MKAPVAQRDQPAPAERPRGRLGPAAAAHRGPPGPLRAARPRARHARRGHDRRRLAAGRSAGRSRPPRAGRLPGLELYDLRVFDDNGAGDEFAVLAALQFVRWLNTQSAAPVIHGVNLSLSLDHEVAQLRLRPQPGLRRGRAAARQRHRRRRGGRQRGPADLPSRRHTREGYRTVSITDPGNADGVITVGSTHRHQPHTYGVSYFSSRGPTGDGRVKPDLVAPGEKITAPVPSLGLKRARRHEHGRAARLGRRGAADGAPPRADRLSPREVKRVLCDDRHRPRPRALLPGRRHGRRPAGDPGGVSDGLLARGAAGRAGRLACCCTPATDLCLIDGGPARPGRRACARGSTSCAQARVARRRPAADRPRDGQPHRRRPHRRPHRHGRRDGRARRRPRSRSRTSSAASGTTPSTTSSATARASCRGRAGPVVASVGQGRLLRDQSIRLGWPRNDRSAGSWWRRGRSRSAPRR